MDFTKESPKNVMMLQHATKLYYTEKLYDERFYGNVKDSMWFYHLETLVRIQESPTLIKEYLQYNIMNIIEGLELPQEINNFCLLNDFDVVPRHSSLHNVKNKNSDLNWHFDNRVPVVHPLEKKEKLRDIEIIGEFKNKVYGLWDMKRRPKYSMVIYFNSHDIDFTGGELLFIDGIFKPSYGDVVFFNSNEIHKANRANGTRNALLLKFYDIDKDLYDM